MVHRERRDQRTGLAHAVPAPPCHQLGNIVAGNVGQETVWTQKLDQQCKPVLGGVSACMVLANFKPVAVGNVVEPQRCLAAVIAATCALAFSRSATSTFSASRRVVHFVEP